MAVDCPVQLDGLVRLNRRHSGRAADLLAEAFESTPMFEYLFPERAVRLAVMRIIYRTIARMAIAGGEAWATSEALEGVLFVRFPQQKRHRLPELMALLRGLLLPLRLVFRVPVFKVLRRARAMAGPTREMRRIIGEAGEHIYVDMVAVHARYRGMGHMSRMMRPILGVADRLGMLCLLETETAANVEIYRHFGLGLIKTIPVVPDTLDYYILSYEPRGRQGMPAAQGRV